MKKPTDGERFKAFLKECGIGPKKFADAAGVTEVSVYRFFKYEEIKPHTWTKIEKGFHVLGVDPAAIAPASSTIKLLPKPIDMERMYKIVDEFKKVGLVDRLLLILSMNDHELDIIKALCGYQQRDK